MEHNTERLEDDFPVQMGDSQVQHVKLPGVFPWFSCSLPFATSSKINWLRPEMQAEEVDFATRLKGRTTNTGSSGCPATVEGVLLLGTELWHTRN